MGKKILVTGSCGFIFSNFVIYALQHTDWEIVSIDKLTYAGSLLNVPQVKRHKLHIGDICDYHFVKKIFDIEKPDIVIQAAAESHVDNSIESSHDFVRTNVVGTHSMLEAALKVHTPEKFINCSTDEVYGSVESGSSLETDMLDPRSPYCVTPNTKVLLENGKEVEIKNISKSDSIVSVDAHILANSSDLLKANCVNATQPTGIYKKPYDGAILKIETNHNVLNCTPEHVLFVRRPRRVGKNKLDYRQSFNNVPILEVHASDVVVGDWLVCPRKVDFKGKKSFGKDFWRFVGYFVGDGSIHKNYGGRKSKHIRLADTNEELLHKYGDIIANVTFDTDTYDKYNKAISLFGNKQYSSQELKEFCEDNNIARARVRRWVSGKRKPILCAKPSYFKHSSKNCWYLKFGHKKTLETLDGLGITSYANDKEIPGILFDSTNEEIASFLAGLFDADGTITNNNSSCSSISYSSASIKLVDGVRALLRRFGIISTINKAKKDKYTWYKLIISDGSSVGIFKNEIPVFKYFDKIKFGNSQKNLYGEYIYHSIVRGIKSENNICNEVYDIENAQDHNFIASGIVVHNSSTKASADLLGQSYFTTHGLPIITTRCSNNFGPRQHAEKFVPKTITNILTGKKIPLYGDGKNQREWIYVLDHFYALKTLIEKGVSGEVYNISSGHEKQNIEVLETIFEIMGGRELLEYVEDRKGHDRRYSVDCNKLKALGWESQYPFENALAHTIGWYKANPWCWRK